MPKPPPQRGLTTLAAPLFLLGALAWLSAVSCGRPDPEGDLASLRQQLAGSTVPEQLNVVLITIDTLRADRLSSFGSPVKTPNIDRLATEGVLFTNASTTVPFTFPAHSSIMTGTYPPFHGVRENVGYYLGDESTTLAQTLAAAGWQTAGFVSAFVLDSRWGIARGFEHYFDDFDPGAFEDANMASVQRPGTETIAAALGWLDGAQQGPKADQPFFLWLHLFDAHDPYTPPEPFRSQYPGQPYEAEVAYTDSLVGGFVDELGARGLMDRSLVVLTADHGEGLGDHGENFHGYFVYDSTVHVPLVFRFPGRAPAGKRVATAVSHVDIVPTILDLTAQEIPQRLQGRSLLTTLGSEAETPSEDDSEPAVYAESFYPLLHYGWAAQRSLRSTTHKYIEAPSPELFDLVADPHESRNLVAGQQRAASRMARSLEDLAARLDDGAATTSTPDLDEQALAQLQALGYLAGPGKETAGEYDPRVARPDPKEKVHLHRRLMRAQSLVGSDQRDQAAELLRQTLEEDPNLLDAHQLLGNIELEADRPETAAAHFESALALDSHHKTSLFGLARSHHKLGRIDEALLGYRRLLDIAGQDSKTTLAIADIEVERGDLAAAEEVLAGAAQPGAPAMLFNRLGEIQALDGRPEDARRNLEAAIAGNPSLSQPHFNLAVLFEENGDLDRAQQQYEEAIDKAPKHYKAQFNLGRLWGRLGDARRERELLEQALASKPDFAIGHFFLGKSLMEGNELERAEEVTRAGLAIVDDSPLGWFVLADILNRRGRAAEAGQALDHGRTLSQTMATAGGL
jgi:arylsulfatase A-like enzyme/Tfp pilus assembly protein PilF